MKLLSYSITTSTGKPLFGRINCNRVFEHYGEYYKWYTETLLKADKRHGKGCMILPTIQYPTNLKYN